VDPLLDVPDVTYLLARGPFTEAGERQLMRDHDIDAVLAKNSGGSATYAKIAAARDLGIEVVLVRRPVMPDAPFVATVEEAVAEIAHREISAAKRGV